MFSKIPEDLILSPCDMIHKYNIPGLSVWSFSVIFDVVAKYSGHVLCFDGPNFTTILQGAGKFHTSIIVRAVMIYSLYHSHKNMTL